MNKWATLKEDMKFYDRTIIAIIPAGTIVEVKRGWSLYCLFCGNLGVYVPRSKAKKLLDFLE